MFTGIVTDLGRIVGLDRLQHGARMIRVTCSLEKDALAVGNSISCSGICLTIAERGLDDSGKAWFQIVASEETRRCTTLDGWLVGDAINLEPALQISSRLGGHIMSGHVDGIGKIASIEEIEGCMRVWSHSPPELARYIAPKCSIGLDGVSLTVNETHAEKDAFSFRTEIVPHTRGATRWACIEEGAAVNIEIDMLARYIENLLKHKEL